MIKAIRVMTFFVFSIVVCGSVNATSVYPANQPAPSTWKDFETSKNNSLSCLGLATLIATKNHYNPMNKIRFVVPFLCGWSVLYGSAALLTYGCLTKKESMAS